jgi:hypothetical protein
MAVYTYTPELVRSSRLMSGPGGPEPIGPDDTLQSGWVPHEDRTAAQNAYHDRVVAESPRFAFAPLAEPQPGDKTCLWDIAKKVLGKPFPAYYQITGSCVGNGGGKAIRYCALTDIYVRGDAERFSAEFYPFTYGRSRLRGGMRNRGEGSFGSSFAEAAREDGVPWWDMEGLPRPSNPEKDWSYGRSVELEWSDGDARPCVDWLEKAKAHRFETAPVKSADEVREAIRSYQPVTIASNWGGSMRCPVQGEPGVLLNARRTTWMHQMMISGWWWHPTLGEIFYVENSWSEDAHGTCPSGAPKGGFWVRKGEVDYITRQDDSFRFNSLTGRDPGHVDWDWLKKRPA